ncbi:MAG: hypothetical protein LBQ18_00045 [Campylobacteraceae bacterium]|jgi:hypothetical protein|nr:hypothetical protein [Campylobacteraceae bacterium]
MKQFIFLSFTLLLFYGCAATNSTSISLANTDSGVVFSAADCQSALPLSYLGSTYRGGRIDISRNFYQNGQSVLVHERGQLDSDFIFTVSLDSLTLFAFELKNPKLSSLGNFHTYIEGNSRAGDRVFIIAAGIGVFETFNLFYSDDEEMIKALAGCVKDGKSVTLEAKSGTPKMSPNSYIRSDFSPMLFFKYNIISSKHEGRRFLPYP